MQYEEMCYQIGAASGMGLSAGIAALSLPAGIKRLSLSGGTTLLSVSAGITVLPLSAGTSGRHRMRRIWDDMGGYGTGLKLQGAHVSWISEASLVLSETNLGGGGRLREESQPSPTWCAKP